MRAMTDSAKKPWWKNKVVWGAVAALVVIGGIGSALDGGDTSTTTAQPAVPTPAVAVTEAASEATTEQAAADTTSGGIGYGEAVQACDAAAQEQLFVGADYDSDAILGQQKGQVGMSPEQYLAVYNVKVDGRKTAITCLVDGTKDAVNVISVKETTPA